MKNLITTILLFLAFNSFSQNPYHWQAICHEVNTFKNHKDSIIKDTTIYLDLDKNCVIQLINYVPKISYLTSYYYNSSDECIHYVVNKKTKANKSYTEEFKLYHESRMVSYTNYIGMVYMVIYTKCDFK